MSTWNPFQNSPNYSVPTETVSQPSQQGSGSPSRANLVKGGSINVVGNTIQTVQESFQSAQTKARQEQEKYKSLSKLNSSYTFPTELASLKRPILELRCLQNHSIIENGTSVYLPAPENLSYSNSSTYNDSELGIMGNAVLGAGKGLMSAKNVTDGLSGVAGLAGELWSGVTGTNVKAGLLAALGSSNILPDQGMKDAVGIAAGARFNPYVVTSFDGSDTRQYNFSFKFIPSSEAESFIIQDIVKLFQVAVYGELEGFLLKYPPKWKLSVLFGQGNEQLKPISAFHECYLTKCDVLYNGSSNSYFYDGSPVETDIELGFVETKALHAGEIANLLTK